MKNPNLINMTGHHITVMNEAGEKQTIKYDGFGIVRLSTTTTTETIVSGFKVASKSFGEAEGVPLATHNVLYIVSGIVLSYMKAQGRTDFIAPDTSPEANPGKDENGRISYVTRFCS